MSETKDVRAELEAAVDANIAAEAEWLAHSNPVAARVAVQRGIACAKALAALEPAPKHAGCEWAPAAKFVSVDPTDQMVDAACAVDWGNDDERATAINVWHAMFAAAPPAPAASHSGGEVVVKALEWRRGYCDDQVIIEQASFGGLYQVRQFDGDIWLDHPSASSSKHETVGAAKAAAQADFEQRIRSALTSPEAPQASEVVRELVEALELAANSAGFQYMTYETRAKISAALSTYKRITTDGNA